MITFEIPGEPVGKGRPRFAKGRTYTPAKTVAYEAHVAACARRAITEPLSGPIHVRVQAVFAVPKSWTKKKKDELMWRPHTQKPDIDNVFKSIADGMEGIAYANDSQIASMDCDKAWGDTSRVMVSIRAK